MEKFTVKYKDFMFETLDNKFKDKITDKYKSLKRGILLLLDNSIENPDELVNVQNFISEYIEDPNSKILVGFVDDAEIFDFYLKYQSNVDEICVDKKYFDKIPVENNIFSLYNFITEGTKFAVLECLKILQTEIFKEG
ncbi:MAG: hypothetical protein HPY57_14490 [Ignavibacteria bacterium]|nr:hypothetical protein [Ignavibacteria bacterium]